MQVHRLSVPEQDKANGTGYFGQPSGINDRRAGLGGGFVACKVHFKRWPSFLNIAKYTRFTKM